MPKSHISKAGANAEEANVTGYVIEYREPKSDEEWSQTDKGSLLV